MMMIKIRYRPTFIRQYKKLQPSLQEEVKEKISLFEENPHHPFLKTHKLKGKLQDFWSFSVNYAYRIIFVYENDETVALLVVGDHSLYQ